MKTSYYQSRRLLGMCPYGKCREPHIPNSVFCAEHHQTALNTQRERTKLLKTEVMSHYCGGTPHCQCPGCTTSELEYLTIDHIDGDGRFHVDPSKTRRIVGIELLTWLKRKKFPSNFQVLCDSCNRSKGRHKSCVMSNLPHECGFTLSEREAKFITVPAPRAPRPKGSKLTRVNRRTKIHPVKVIVSFSIDELMVDRIKRDCALKRISFSQYAEFALESAPPVTEELAIKLARKKRGLPETSTAVESAD